MEGRGGYYGAAGATSDMVPRGGTDERARPNLLVVSVSPEEGIVIRVGAKQQGQEMRLQSINLD